MFSVWSNNQREGLKNWLSWQLEHSTTHWSLEELCQYKGVSICSDLNNIALKSAYLDIIDMSTCTCPAHTHLIKHAKHTHTHTSTHTPMQINHYTCRFVSAGIEHIQYTNQPCNAVYKTPVAASGVLTGEGPCLGLSRTDL